MKNIVGEPEPDLCSQFKHITLHTMSNVWISDYRDNTSECFPGTFWMAIPKRTNGSLRSASCMSAAVSVIETIAVAFEV